MFLWAGHHKLSENYSNKVGAIMLDISDFDLVKLDYNPNSPYYDPEAEYQNNKLYAYQCELIKKSSKENYTDFVLKLALLQTMSPAENHSVSINILQKYYKEDDDIRVGILGAHLSSVWECYKDNKFLPKLKETLPKLNDNQQKSIIYYLLAYDMFRKEDFKTKKDIYIDLLTKSVNLSENFVYNYYDLAQISNNKNAKELMYKAFAQIKTISGESNCEKLTLKDFVSYDFYLNERILGVYLSYPNFDSLVELYNNLKQTKKHSFFKSFR